MVSEEAIKVYDSWLDSDMLKTPYETALYILLVYKAGEKQIYHPDYHNLAKECRTNESHIKSLLKKFEKRGLITEQPDGSYFINIITYDQN